MSTNRMGRIRGGFAQFACFTRDAGAIVNRRWWRLLSIWFSASFWAIATYRFERACWLFLGPAYPPMRIVFQPIAFLVRPWCGGRCEVHYRANLGGKLAILHPSLGVVVSANTVAGEGLTLTGGNVIGGRRALRHGDISIGSNVTLGANAVILGPVTIGSNVTVGAGAVVVRDIADEKVVVGVPARPID